MDERPAAYDESLPISTRVLNWHLFLGAQSRFCFLIIARIVRVFPSPGQGRTRVHPAHAQDIVHQLHSLRSA